MGLVLSPTHAWMILLVAGALEIVWVMSMKASEGFTKIPYVALTIVTAWLSFWLLGLAMRVLPVGTAYAVWTGIGAVGAATLGIMFFGDAFTIGRVACIGLIVVGIVGLKLLSGSS